MAEYAESFVAGAGFSTSILSSSFRDGALAPDPESIFRSAEIMDSGLAAFGRAPE